MTVLFNQWSHNVDSWKSLYRLVQFNGNSKAPSEVDTTGYIDVVPDPAGGDFRCIRMQCNPTDAAIGGARLRTEIFPTSNCDQGNSTWGGEYEDTYRWIRFAVYVDPSWQLEPSFVGQRPTCYQQHERIDTNPADEVVMTPLWIRERIGSRGQGLWRVEVAWCEDETTTDAPDPINYFAEHPHHAPMRFGAWQEWVIHRKVAHDETGVLEVWVDGRRKFTRLGPNCFNNHPDRGGGLEYDRIGIYYGLHPSDGVQKTTPAVIYYKGMQIADEEYATYDEFMSALGETQIELERVSGPVSAGAVIG